MMKLPPPSPWERVAAIALRLGMLSYVVLSIAIAVGAVFLLVYMFQNMW